ncbi:MAG: polysaccharide biosynthesis/export family protein [Hyphomicrobiaceae bacterium]
MSVWTAAAMLAGLGVASCSSAPPLPPPSFATADANNLERVYRLGIGDKLKITVFGEDNLSGNYEVNALGQISMPLIGEVTAQGVAIAAFREHLVKRLAAGYLKSPRVTVEVLNYRPIYVHGEVKSGGEYPFKTGLKLRDAIAVAGGFTYRADEQYVVVVREGAGEARVPLSSSFAVFPGDNIRVLERFF